MCTVGGCTSVFMPNSGDQRNFQTKTGFPLIQVLYQTGCTVYEKSPILFIAFLTSITRHVQLNLNFTFTSLKCLKYRNKGKDHSSQTQQYFIKFLKYINNNMGILLLIYFKNL